MSFWFNPTLLHFVISNERLYSSRPGNPDISHGDTHISQPSFHHHIILLLPISVSTHYTCRRRSVPLVLLLYVFCLFDFTEFGFSAFGLLRFLSFLCYFIFLTVSSVIHFFSYSVCSLQEVLVLPATLIWTSPFLICHLNFLFPLFISMLVFLYISFSSYLVPATCKMPNG